jgi:hypothetical protein
MRKTAYTFAHDALIQASPKPFQFVFDEQFLFFKGGNAKIIPIGMRHFDLDKLFEFLMLFGKLLDMSFRSHARTSHVEGWRN